VPLLTNSEYRLLMEVSRYYAELNPENYATAHRLYDLGLVSLTDHGRIDITDEGRRFLLGGP
jgi:Mn-dependent DtxR family transcriptional regulator